MKTIVRLSVALTLLAAGCGKKNDDAGKNSGDPHGATGTTTSSAGGATSSGGAQAGPVHTANGGEVSSAPTVTDCPKSLSGSESVNRVITKDCGVVQVTEDYHLNNGTLTIEAGSTLAFADNTEMHIGYNDTAKLIVKGTADAPVKFTAAGDKVAGVWKGISLYDHADRSSIDHLVVEWAGPEDGNAVHIDAQDVSFTNSSISGSKGDGVAFAAKGTAARFEGNSFAQIGKAPITVSATGAGGLGAGNKLPDNALIQVYGGTIAHDVKWQNAGAPYWITDDVHVEGGTQRVTLEIAAGTELRMNPNATFTIGYSSPAGFKVSGTKDAPVLFTSFGDKKPGGWQNVRIYDKGEANVENAIFEYGGTSDNGGALQSDGGALSVKNSTFRNDVIGIASNARGTIKMLEGNTFTANDKGAIWISAEHIGSLGTGNTYDAGAKIEVDGGKVEQNATWHAQGAVFEVMSDVAVDGRIVLTIEAGAQFAMREGITFGVGYREAAALHLAGTTDKPIKFVGVRDEAGSWKGITLYNNSRDSEIANVVLRDAGNDPGAFRIDEGVNVKIDGLTCSKCSSPAVGWPCGAKVTTANVKADEGTPKDEAKPEGCAK